MTIQIDDDGEVRRITLDRPQVRNAIDIPMRIALASALEEADADPGVRAVVLTGAGPVFCSGGDIATMRRSSPEEAIQRTQLAQKVIRAIWATAKPVVAAVEGAAYGAGVSLAAACDRVVAARDVRLATTFVNVGLAGDMGIYASLPARIGVARARQMLMMAQPVDAERALNWGLVDALADPGGALRRAMEDAQLLAGRPAGAMATIKRMLATAPRSHPLDVLDHEAGHQSKLFDSDDFAEGVAAFREKRPARFASSYSPQQGVQR